MIQKKSPSKHPGDVFFPRGLLACTVDVCPLPAGPQLGLQQSSRGEVKRGKGSDTGSRVERKLKEQNKKFHLFWVGWLIL